MHPENPPEQHALIAKATGVTAEGCSWTVLTGDVAFALREIETACVDCVVTSPPYYWQRDYGVIGQIGHESTIRDYVAALVRAFGELRRTLKPGGTFFLNLGDTYYSAKGRPHGRDDKHNGRQMMRQHLRAVDGPGLGLPKEITHRHTVASRAGPAGRRLDPAQFHYLATPRIHPGAHRPRSALADL
jgi:hypothetical protein